MPSTALASISSIQYPCWAFVDYENHHSLRNISFSLYSKVIIFISDACTKIDFKYIARQIPVQFEVLLVDGKSKNNMDFHIALKLGQLHETEAENIEFHIISNDRGVDGIIQLLNKLGRKCARYSLWYHSKANTNNTDNRHPSSTPPLHTNSMASNTDPQSVEGEDFLNWLRDGLSKRAFRVNKKNAKIHMTKDGLLLVSPDIFKQFNKNQWSYAQKRFTKLRLHEKTSNGTNIHEYTVTAARKLTTIKGYLITDTTNVYPGIKLPDVNLRLSKIGNGGIRKKPDKKKISGRGFLHWLREKLEQKKFRINGPRSNIHVVQAGLLLVCPNIFRLYAGGVLWGQAQSNFKALKLHEPRPDDTGLSVHTFHYSTPTNNGKHKTIKGILIKDYEKLFRNVQFPDVNRQLIYGTPKEAA